EDVRDEDDELKQHERRATSSAVGTQRQHGSPFPSRYEARDRADEIDADRTCPPYTDKCTTRVPPRGGRAPSVMSRIAVRSLASVPGAVRGSCHRTGTDATLSTDLRTFPDARP